MEYNLYIADMKAGDKLEGFYILKSAQIKTSNTGKAYLAASIQDTTGAMDVKVWDYSGPIGEADVGVAVKVRGEVTEFKGALQLIVGRIRLTIDSDLVDYSRLVPVAPIQKDSEMEWISGLINSMEDAEYQRLASAMLEKHKETFSSIPAAKSVHHSFISGLLMHTVNMLRAADFMAELYGEVIDRSLLLTGTLVHDMAKDREFAFSKLGLVNEYTTEGQLIGHLVMGAQEVGEVGKELGISREKIMLVQHMLLSHHGEPEFGAAVRPMCAEAELLYYLDTIDSRMEIYTESLLEVNEGQFTNRIFALDRKIYNHGLPKN